MNLDELQSVQARERQSSDLQHLRSSFYREVGEFISELTEKRARAVEAADDPFSEPEVRRLSDDIETAEGTVEAIYERRVGKVVKKASIAAAGMPVEEDGLTNEEAALFEELVDRIERNRETVLSVLDGDAPSVSCSVEEGSEVSGTADSGTPTGKRNGQGTETPPAPGTDDEPNIDEPGIDDTPNGVSAAELMGGGGNGEGSNAGRDGSVAEPDAPPVAPDEPSPEPDRTTAEQPRGDTDPDHTPDVPSIETVASESPDSGGETGNIDRPNNGDRPGPEPSSDVGDISDDTENASGDTVSDSNDTGSQVPNLPRTTVRITAEVGEIVGADDRDYDLGSEDVVTLPEPNADVLVEKGAAERF